MLAYCGIDCSQCRIYQAANDPEKAEALAGEWRASGRAKASAEWFKCQGCSGPDELVWTSSCKIRACCRGKGLANCSQCDGFPCELIEKFEADGGTHAVAVDLLRTMHSGNEQ